FAVLNRPVADVLGGGKAKYVPRGSGGRHVAHPAPNHNAKLSLKIRSMVLERHFNFSAVRQKRSSCLEPEQGLFWQRLAALPRMVGVIQSHRDDFGLDDRRERS